MYHPVTDQITQRCSESVAQAGRDLEGPVVGTGSYELARSLQCLRGMTTRKTIACSSNYVGEIVLMGRHGGAYVQHYQITEIANGEATMIPVKSERIDWGGGMFGSKFVPLAEGERPNA